MADYNSIRSRHESTDSLDSSTPTTEDYSDEDKDGLDIEDFNIIKTIGKYTYLLNQSIWSCWYRDIFSLNFI